jgi:hypothetical protein
MKTKGCKQWSMVKGIRGAWCWIDESEQTGGVTGVVITFLDRLGLDSFVNTGEINKIIEQFPFYDEKFSQLQIEVHENLQGGEITHHCDKGWWPESRGRSVITKEDLTDAWILIP